MKTHAALMDFGPEILANLGVSRFEAAVPCYRRQIMHSESQISISEPHDGHKTNVL